MAEEEGTKPVEKTTQPTPAPANPTPSPGTPAAAVPAARPAPAAPPPPRPKTVTEDVTALQARFPNLLTHVEDTDPKIPTVVLTDRILLPDVARFLQTERQFEHLALITTVDYKAQGLEVIYNFWSYSRNVPFEIKVKVTAADPKVPSLTSLWAGADWHERENYDLMGIVFDGHPNLKRILLPEGWRGHPYRKDYEWKKEQYVGLDPVTGEDVVYSEPREGAW